MTWREWVLIVSVVLIFLDQFKNINQPFNVWFFLPAGSGWLTLLPSLALAFCCYLIAREVS